MGDREVWGSKRGREIEGGEGGIARGVEGYGRGGGGEREGEGENICKFCEECRPVKYEDEFNVNK